MRTMQERFEAKVTPEPNSGCWLWTGALSRQGYGTLGKRYAHRIAWEIEHGPIPPGKVIDHLCRNRACSNTRHMEVVTHRVNILRGRAPSIVAHVSDTCQRGHVGSFKMRASGWQFCTTCDKESRATYQAVNKDRIRASRKEHYASDPERPRARAMAWHWNNRERALARMAERGARKRAALR